MQENFEYYTQETRLVIILLFRFYLYVEYILLSMSKKHTNHLVLARYKTQVRKKGQLTLVLIPD